MIFTGSELIAHEGVLLGYANKQVKDKDLAQDLVQTTYMKAIRSQHLYKPEEGGNLGAWLMTILKRVIIDYWDQQKLKRILPMTDAPLEEWQHPAVVDKYDLGETFEDERLEEAYQELIPIYKDIVRLTWVEDYSEDEIQSKSGLSRKNIKQRRFRAKARMESFLIERVV